MDDSFAVIDAVDNAVATGDMDRLKTELNGVRLRIPELLAERGWTAYELAKRSGGLLSLTWCYNVVANDGVWSKLTPIQLTVLVVLFKVAPGRLFGPIRRKDSKGWWKNIRAGLEEVLDRFDR